MNIEYYRLFGNKPNLMNSLPLYLDKLSTIQLEFALELLQDWPDVSINFFYFNSLGVVCSLDDLRGKRFYATISKQTPHILSIHIGDNSNVLVDNITRINISTPKIGQNLQEMIDEFRSL